MPGMPKKLSVMIPVRDRLVLTKKCIESILLNSEEFNEVSIYVFDNKSDIDSDRFNYFQTLLQQNKICYYSYDTNKSCYNCFGKAVTFKRWVSMMEEDMEVRKLVCDSSIKHCEQYYMLIDNDFIVGPGWSKPLISSAKFLRSRYPQLHYIVPFPGGTPERFRANKEVIEIDNVYNNEKIKVHFANRGGSSGLWFTWYEGLVNLKWDFLSMAHTYNADKRHDSETWNYIRRTKGDINYVSCIETPNPVALHIGPLTGSICNFLTKNTYLENKDIIQIREKEIFDPLSVMQIWEKYKNTQNRW